MLTVRDLVERLELPVLAGQGGLEKPVRWVHISELLDPTQWLSGGEVLLTTAMQLDSAGRQRDFVDRLADHQLAALGIGTGFRHPEVPQALLETAAERDFPLFEVPYEVPFIAITEAAFAELVNEQYAVLRGALAAHERLERIVLSERGLDALGGAIASLIGGTVLVFDGRGRPRVGQAVRRELSEKELRAIQREVREHAQRREPRAFVPAVGSETAGTVALPVTAEGSPSGAAPDRAPEAWLVAIKDSEPLSDFDRLVLHQAVTIVALELLRSRVAGETERRLAGDVLRDLVSGELAGPELARRLEPFGLGTEVATIVLADGEGTAADWKRRSQRRCGTRPSRLSLPRRQGSPARWSRACESRSCSRSRTGWASGCRPPEAGHCGLASGAQPRPAGPGGASTRLDARSRRWRWAPGRP